MPRIQIKELSNDQDTVTRFLEENHKDGPSDFCVAYGVYSDDDLIALMALRVPHQNNNHQFELVRECSKKGLLVNGWLKAVWDRFIEEWEPDDCIVYSKPPDAEHLFNKRYIDNCGFRVRDKAAFIEQRGKETITKQRDIWSVAQVVYKIEDEDDGSFFFGQCAKRDCEDINRLSGSFDDSWADHMKAYRNHHYKVEVMSEFDDPYRAHLWKLRQVRKHCEKDGRSYIIIDPRCLNEHGNNNIADRDTKYLNAKKRHDVRRCPVCKKTLGSHDIRCPRNHRGDRNPLDSVQSAFAQSLA